MAMEAGEHAAHGRPIRRAAKIEPLHLDKRHAVAIGLGRPHARGAKCLQPMKLGGIHSGVRRRALLTEAQTPESRRFAMESRSTRISMNARSNLWRQLSEARARWSVGTEMMFASVVTV